MDKTFTRRRIQIGIILIICSCSLLFSENDKKKSSNSSEDATFRVPVNAIALNATVLDKKGNPVTDLKPEDFRIYDDGKLVPIQTFSTESYDYEQLEKAEPARQGAAKPDQAPSPQNEVKQRLISLIIDDILMTSPDGLNLIKKYIQTYVETSLGKFDQISLLSASGKAIIPFSNNKEQFIAALPKAFEKLNYLPIARATCPVSMTDLQAFRIDADLNMINTYRTLLSDVKKCMQGASIYRDDPSSGATTVPITDVMAESYVRAMATSQNAVVQYNTYNLFSIIKQHLRILRRYEGIKSVVLFSEGILAERFTPAEHKVQEIIDLAIRSGIVFNIVNQRGVRVYLGRDNAGLPPLMDSDHDPDYAIDSQARESTLQQIAHDTGGTYHNNNDMFEGLQKAIKKQSFQYLMSYGMPLERKPGTYHKIKVETTRPDLQISYRKGYYIGKEELNVQSSKKEDILSAMYAPGDISEIPVLLSYNYLKEPDGSYSASFITKADVKKIQFIKEEDRRKNTVHVVLAAFDENDHFVNGLEKALEFQLLDDSYSALLNHGISSKVDLKLPPGHYKIKTVIREANQGKMGSIAKAVDIP